MRVTSPQFTTGASATVMYTSSFSYFCTFSWRRSWGTPYAIDTVQDMRRKSYVTEQVPRESFRDLIEHASEPRQEINTFGTKVTSANRRVPDRRRQVRALFAQPDLPSRHRRNQWQGLFSFF